MSTFTDLRSQLAQARSQRSAADSQLAVKREQLKSVERQIAALSRQGTASADRQKTLSYLKRQQSTLKTDVDRSREQAAAAKKSVDSLQQQLTVSLNPAQQLAQLSDNIPILLFPVRLEVRFRPQSGQTGPQLWIRIYPDACQIDTFEAMLSDSEFESAAAFWIAMWRAGSQEPQERGAWRVLAGATGAGRAAYIVGQYVPANLVDKPKKANAQDVVLVIVPQTTVTKQEQSEAFAYWTSVWAANGDYDLEQKALAAFQKAVGAARAADLMALYAPDPHGWNPPAPFTRADVQCSCAVLVLPPAPTAKRGSWTQAARMVAQPDRFVAHLYSGGVLKTVIGNTIPDGLATGPDPSLPADKQLTVVNDDLMLNDDLKWLADFEQAVAVGMGIKVALTPSEAANGFDRLLVVGVRVSTNETDSQKLLETLITHQGAVAAGYSLLAQGSPTNNTASDGAAYSWVGDPDAAYDIVFKGKEAYAETSDPLKRRDGQWLAQALGINNQVMKQVPNAAGTDQLEARALNTALWNGTLGYMLEEMLTSVVSPADIAATRTFFTTYVSGRGPLPAVRVGRQPYGILPITLFPTYQGSANGLLPQAYIQRLHTVLAKLDNEWQALSAKVARVGQAGDPHQVLLDIVGLQSGSVEYHQRYAESVDQLYNKLVLELGASFAAIMTSIIQSNRQAVLTALGADPAAKPPILEKFFFGSQSLLTGPLIDDSPLSESKPIRAYSADKKNYIEWLASVPLDAIRQQNFGGNPAPAALLYLMLRHSMMLSQWDAGTRLLEKYSLVNSTVARAEPAFINVQSGGNGGQSKFQYIIAPQPVITGSQTQPLAEYVLSAGVLGVAPETVNLSQTIAALKVLTNTPTARLERLFAEHIDTCSYRLDAWKTALATNRLAEMRVPREGPVHAGIYLGAFGWLENVRPQANTLTKPALTPDQAKDFARPGDAPLSYDSQNAGYIHAPSLSQAAAAAILKNAYRVNATPANPDAMAVNLSSERVRAAQTILEGMRNGQTLAALLGYRFERGLHDEHNLAEVDKFIYPLRQVFPLAGNQLKNTADQTVDISLVEARNVIDGVQFVNRLRLPGNATYPFGIPVGAKPGQIPSASAAEIAALNIEADRLLNLHDALGDLVMAESVFQVVLGNFDRSAAVANAFSTGAHPPEIQVVDTPRTGFSLTHRVALHLDPAADPGKSPNASPMTPRASAEAPLNAWLNQRLPAPDVVEISVTYWTPAMANPQAMMVNLADLGLQPVDLLFLVNFDLDQAMAEIDDRILQFIRYGPGAHPAVAVTINYTEPGKVTLFEVAELVRNLREIILKSRAAGPTDMTMPLESAPADAAWDDAELGDRLKTAISGLTGRRDMLLKLQKNDSDLDGYIEAVTFELLLTALYGMPQTGTGSIHSDVRAICDAIAGKVGDVIARWEQKSSDYAALMSGWPSLSTDADRFSMLSQAERLISATSTAVVPADPNVYKTAVEGLKSQFDGRLAALQGLLVWSGSKLVDFANAVESVAASVAVHDLVPLNIADQLSAMAVLEDNIEDKVAGVAADLTQRIDAANTALNSVFATASSSESRVQQLLTIAKTVLGSEMQVVPRFQLDSARAAEFAGAWAASADLLVNLHAAGRRFPVDDWLYGLARVRPKLAAWESVVVLSEVFGASPQELTPVQLPYVQDDRWTALEFDTDKATRNDRLLYTAQFPAAFQPSGKHCGLILDEWPETVPVKDVVSGLAFHFDRPNSQPPQTMLLAVPPVIQGAWSWNDLIAMLNQTLDDAKKRGVEPAFIDATNYAAFLPATVMAVTLYQITIATNLGVNNNVYANLVSK